MAGLTMQPIKEFLSSFNISFTNEQGIAFEKHMRFLQEANKHINLTSITKDEEIIEKHFIDSLSILKIVGMELLAGEKKMVDIGAGAGFPGIPIKLIFPNVQLTLVDSVQKKVRFLEGLCRELSLSNTTCVAGRAETLGQDARFREQFDIAVARAVSKISVLAEYLLPFTCVGGSVVIYKGGEPEDELQQSKKAIALLGGSLEKVEKFSIGANSRSLILIKKTKATPDEFPRKDGVPDKKPL